MKPALILSFAMFFFSLSFAQNGTLNPSFANGGKLVDQCGFPFFTVAASCVMPDGKIVVAGSSANDNRSRSNELFLMRFNADGTPDAGFGTDGMVYTDIPGFTDDYVRQVQSLPDGRLLVLCTGGSYKRCIIRYKNNGSLDSSFVNGSVKTPMLEVNGHTREFVVQTDGKILTCDDEFGLGASYPNNFGLERYNANGTPDNTFKAPHPNNYGFSVVHSTSLLPDGKIIIAGRYSRDLIPKVYVARLLPTGTLDSSFAVNGIQDFDLAYSNFYTVQVRTAQQSRIVLFDSYYLNDTLRFAAHRLLTNGTPDVSIGAAGSVFLPDSLCDLFDQYPPSFQFTADGSIVLPLTTYKHHRVREMAVLRLKENWQPDLAYGEGGLGIIPSAPNAWEAALAVPAPNGKVYLAGYDNSPGRYKVALAALLPGGSYDPSFSSGGKTSRAAGTSSFTEDGFVDMLVHSNGQITTAGLAENGTTASLVLSRFFSNGERDSSFGKDGRIYLSFKSYSYYSSIAIKSRFSSAHVIALKEDKAGNLYVAIDENERSGRHVAMAVFKLSFNGLLDQSFGYAGRAVVDMSIHRSNTLRGMGIQSDGKIVLAAFVSPPQIDTDYTTLVRLKTNGSVDSSFGQQGVLIEKAFTAYADYQLNAPAQLVVQADDKILLAGQLRSLMDQGYIGMRRYHKDGQLDSSYLLYSLPRTSANALTYTTAIALQPDGKSIVAGKTAGRRFAMRRLATGAGDLFNNQDGSYTGAGRTNVSNILVQPDGKVLLIGDRVVEYQGVISNESYIDVTRLLADGSLDTSYGIAGTRSFPLTTPYYELAGNIGLLPDGNLVVAGVTGMYWGSSYLSAPHGVLYGLSNTIQNCSNVSVDAGNDTTLCRMTGPGITLGSPALSGAAYTWRPNSNLSSASVAQPVANPLISTRYTVKLITPAGCVATDTVWVNIETPVTIPVTYNSSTYLCKGDSVVLRTTAEGPLQWVRGDKNIAGATGQSYTAKDSGFYKVMQVNPGKLCLSASTPVYVYLREETTKPIITSNGNMLTSSMAYGYQWYRNGNFIPGATSLDIVLIIPGIYTVVTTSPMGCASVASEPFSFMPTGINSPVLEKRMILGPNPVQGMLSIQYTGSLSFFEVTLLDLTGKHVTATQKFTSQIQLNMESLTTGMYTVQIRNTKTGEYLQKLIFKHH